MIRGLYAIADSAWNPLGSLSELVSKFLEGGCRLIQLRVKANHESRVTSYESVLKIAGEIAKLKKKWDFTFIVNDYADIAMEVGADGVHVGEGDEKIVSIKKRCGSRFIVGYSSHSIDSAVHAEKEGADYIAFGAIFPTKTKGPGHPVQGLDKLREVVRLIKVPIVAIGGIGRDNIQSVIDTSASAVAMISALAEAKDIVAETRWFVSAIQYPSGGAEEYE